MADPKRADVSHWRELIDFDRAVADGLVELTSKATGGRHYGDPYFPRNWILGHEHGLERNVAFHYLRPGIHPRYQVNVFCQMIEALGFDPDAGDDVQADAEQPGLEAWAIEWWLKGTADRLGVAPEIYTSPGFWNANIGPVAWANEYRLTVAHYTNADRPTLPHGFNTFWRWQYTKRGQVDGINPPVDLQLAPEDLGIEDGEDGGGSDEPFYTAVVTTSPGYRLRVRQEPSLDAAIVAYLESGQNVQVYEELDGWAQISPAGEPARWVSGVWIEQT